MWPWGHAAVGYLVYSAVTRYSDRRPPRPHPVVWLLAGTQFPDLVDKPLVWYIDVLPYGRSLAHSLVVLIPICVLLYVLLARHDRGPSAVAFSIGALLHVVVDALPLVMTGEYAYTYFLLWPILPLSVRPEPGSFTEHLLGIELTPYFLLQIGLTVLAAIIWKRDGLPGISLARATARTIIARVR